MAYRGVVLALTALVLVLTDGAASTRPSDVSEHQYCSGCHATIDQLQKKLAGKASQAGVSEAIENICTPENFITYEYSPPRSIRACQALLEEHDEEIEKAFVQGKKDLKQYICHEITKACEGVDMSAKDTQTSDIDLTKGAAIDGLSTSGLGDVKIGDETMKVSNIQVESNPDSEDKDEDEEDEEEEEKQLDKVEEGIEKLTGGDKSAEDAKTEEKETKEAAETDAVNKVVEEKVETPAAPAENKEAAKETVEEPKKKVQKKKTKKTKKTKKGKKVKKGKKPKRKQKKLSKAQKKRLAQRKKQLRSRRRKMRRTRKSKKQLKKRKKAAKKKKAAAKEAEKAAKVEGLKPEGEKTEQPPTPELLKAVEELLNEAAKEKATETTKATEEPKEPKEEPAKLETKPAKPMDEPAKVEQLAPEPAAKKDEL